MSCHTIRFELVVLTVHYYSFNVINTGNRCMVVNITRIILYKMFDPKEFELTQP